MNEFKVVLTSQAQYDLRQFERPVRNRLTDKLRWMGQNALLLVHQPLKGERWAGTYRYRVGDYRIIYTLDGEQQEMTVLRIGHRRDLCKAT